MTLLSLKEELQEIKAKDLLRKVREIEPLSSTSAKINGKKYLLFCGNDYLGFAFHPYIKQAAIDEIKLSGTGATASRLISGTSSQHTILEEKIASLKNKEKALVFSTGYLANLGTLTALAGKEDTVIMDKLCHASLIDAVHLSGAILRVFPHKNYSKCEELLKKTNRNSGKIILLSDTVFSMDGDLADIKRLIELKRQYETLLILDDAHGTGCLGLKGGGALEDDRLESGVDAITGTLSKSLGVLGGFVASSAEFIDYIINKARPFIYATALPPHLCAAASCGIDLMEREPSIRHKLWKNVQLLHDALKQINSEVGPITSPIFPFIVGPEKKALDLSEFLYSEGIFVPAIRYPTVKRGQARLRISISASHEPGEIKRLGEAIKKGLKEI